MATELRLSDLHPVQRQLVELISVIEFGRIENLLVQDGLPRFAPPPRIIREFKLEREEQAAARAASRGDYLLKTQARRLLGQLMALGDGRVEMIAIAHGLPHRMSIESTGRPVLTGAFGP